MAIGFYERRARTMFVVEVVERPEGWQPEDWFDDPPEGATVVRSAGILSEPEAEVAVWIYNTGSLDHDGDTWAIARPAEQQSLRNVEPVDAEEARRVLAIFHKPQSVN